MQLGFGQSKNISLWAERVLSVLNAGMLRSFVCSLSSADLFKVISPQQTHEAETSSM